MKKNPFQKALLCLMAALLLVSCALPAFASGCEPALEDAATMHDEKFGGFFADIAIEDFLALGFQFGDSVDITLSSGQTLTDVPCYNGYYTRTGEVLVCCYPGYSHIKICRNNGADLFETLDMDETTTASIHLREAGKYLSIQQVMDTVYLNDREAFESDAVFANFRAMRGGDLTDGLFFRSASPVDDEYSRAAFVNALVQEHGIALVLDLADNAAEFAGYRERPGFCSDYTAQLYDSGKVILMDMSTNYRGEAYRESMARGLLAVLENDGPYLIHCTEGKDRTGFAAILIEALCGASYEELQADYMQTYANYYGITAESSPDQYRAIRELKFDDMVLYLAGAEAVEAIQTAALQAGAREYLLSAGMTEAQIDALTARLTGK